MPHGKMINYFKNGQIMSIENYKKEKLQGPYKEYYENGTLKETSMYVDNKLNGEYKTYYENGHLSQSGMVKSGDYVGKYQTFYRNGQKEYVYTHIDDESKCAIKRYFMSGGLESEMGCQKNSGRRGKYKRYYATGSLAEEMDFENQKWIIYYLNGGKYTLTKFINTGDLITKYYQEDGTLWSQHHIKNGKIIDDQGDPLDETKVIKYPNAQPYTQYTLKRGTIQGMYKISYKTGQVFNEVFYKRGRPSGINRFYYLNGQVNSEMYMLNGQFDGLVKEYYANGQLKLKYKLKNRKMNGLLTWYSEEGKILQKGEIIDNRIEGTWQYYDENENILETKQFKAGLLLNKEGQVFNGEDNFYYKDGTLAEEAIYEKGYVKGEKKTYYSTGQLWIKSDCDRGDCQTQEFYIDGTMKFEGTNFLGTNYGITKQYYPTGQLRAEFYRSIGENGYEIRYTPDGEKVLNIVVHQSMRHNL